jgi:hypothetical protein
MRSCKIVLTLAALAPVLSMPAARSWYLASDEPLGFVCGFLVSAKVPLEFHDSTAMATVSSLNLEHDEFTMEVSNVTTDSTAETAQPGRPTFTSVRPRSTADAKPQSGNP